MTSGCDACCRHDFVVVETIEFDEDEDDELPMLLTQRDVVLMNKAGPLEEDDQEPSAAQLANGDARDVEMSEEEKAMVAEADAAAAPVTTGTGKAAEGHAPQPSPEEARQPEAAPPHQVQDKLAFAYCINLSWQKREPRSTMSIALVKLHGMAFSLLFAAPCSLCCLMLFAYGL